MNKTSVAKPSRQRKPKVTIASPDDLVLLASIPEEEQQSFAYLAAMKGVNMIRVTRVEYYVRRADLEAITR